MGNDQQKIHSPHHEIISINHSKFRNVKVVVDGNQKLLKTTMGVQSEDYEKWRYELQHSCLDSTYLLLPKRQEYEDKALCGNSGSLQLYFEDYRYVLSEQINSRRENKLFFDETDLWYLLLVLSSAQQEVKIKSNVKVGDIRPHNIFLNYQGQAKVSCTVSWPRQQATFGEAFDNQRTYLSPQDLINMQRGLDLGAASFQSEVFSIGLTLLCAGLLQDFNKLYKIQGKSCKFNTELANKLVDEWRANKKYSQILTGVVSNLCQFKPKNRINDEQLWRWISQFKDQIRARKNFFIQSAPSKVDKQVTQIRNLFPQTREFPAQLSLQQPRQIQFQHHQYRPQDHLLNPNHSSSPISLRDHINPKYVQSYHESIPSTQAAASSFYSVPKTKNSSTSQIMPKFDKQIQNNFHKRKASEKIVTKQSLENQYSIAPQLNLPDLQMHPRLSLLENNVQGKGVSYIPQKITFNNTNLPPQRVQNNRPYLMIDNQFKNVSPQRLAPNGRVRSNDNGLSYFQNVIDPEGRRGCRIEETVYIQKSDYLNNYLRK